MPCIKLSSGKTVCYGDQTNTYSQGGTIFFNHEPVHFPDGGKTDDTAFKKFVSTLPPNLRNTGSDYNLKGYWESLGKPSAFDYSQPKESDGKYHAYSRNPETGEILKRPNHPTFGQALEEDRKLGYYPYQSPTGVMHTFKPNEVPQGFNVPIYPTLNNIKQFDDGGKTKSNAKKKNYQPSKDVIIQDNEIINVENQAGELAAKYRKCHKGDLECLGSANEYYNRYAARQAGLPTTWEQYQKRGVSNINAWDVAAVPDTEILYNFNKDGLWNSLSEDRKKQIYSNIPIGATISYMGTSTGSQREGKDSMHKKAGLPDTTHAAKVIGHTKDGFPVVYDYGTAKVLDINTLEGALAGYVPQIISYPTEVGGATFVNMNKPGVGLASEAQPYSVIVNPDLASMKKRGNTRIAKIRVPIPESWRLPIGYDAYEASKEYAKTINDFRDTAIKQLGIDPEYYDNALAPAAFGLAGQESEFGTKGEPFAEAAQSVADFFGLNSIFGKSNKSVGPLQLQKSHLNNPKLKELFREYADIHHPDDLYDPAKATKAAIILMNYNKGPMNRAFDKNGVDPEYGFAYNDLLKNAYYYNNPNNIKESKGESAYVRNVADAASYLLPSEGYTIKTKEIPYPKTIFKLPWAPRPPYEKKDGGKNKFNFPISKERQLAEQARMQGDMPVAPGIVKAKEKLREQEAVEKKLAKQGKPLDPATAKYLQKAVIDYNKEHGLSLLQDDVLAEQIRRNQQSLSNPDDRSIEADIAQDLEENGALGLLDAPIKGYMALRTGRYQSPSQAIGRWANESGHQMLRNAMIDDQFNPTGLGMVTDWGGPIALEMAASKAVQAAPKVLKNAYKINPWAVKENPEMFLYRTQPKNFVPGLTEEQVLKNEIANKISKGEQVPWWLTGKLNKIQNSPEPFREALNTYHGQWFDKDPTRMDFYMKGRLDNEVGDILRLKVPKNVGDNYNLKNFPEAQKASLNYDTEFIVPRERLGEAERFSTEDWQKLMDEDKAFNTPHWLKGYQEINGPSKGVISNRLLSNFDPRNLKSKPALDWVKQWHSHPDFVNRYSNNKNLFIGGAERFQKDVLGALDRYQPKNYIDLLKDKGLEDFIEYKLRSQGVSYGTPNNIYVNRTSFFPFNKIGKESVTGHELSHLTDINGLAFTPEDKEALLKPFGYSRSQYYKKFPTNKHRKKGEGYYLDPTEIRARMTQGRMKFDLMPNDKFTPKMFDEMLQSNNWEGMGNYIKDKKGFLDLMNNFWAVPATAVGVGAAAKSVGAEEPVQKDGGKNSGPPIYVNNPNDPRLKAYQDSLITYNYYKNAYENYPDFKKKNLKYEDANKGLEYGDKYYLEKGKFSTEPIIVTKKPQPVIYKPIERTTLEPVESRTVPMLESNFEHTSITPMSVDRPMMQPSNEEYNRQYSITIPTIEINKRQVVPRINRVFGQNRVNPKNQYQRSIDVDTRQLPIMDEYTLNKLRMKLGMDPKGFESGGKTNKTIRLSTGKIVTLK